MTRALWRLLPPAARGKTRAAFASAETTTRRCARTSPRPTEAVHLGLWFYLTMTAAAAEGSPPISLPDQIKVIGTEHGLLGTLLAMALLVIGLLFGLLMKSWSDRRADTEKSALAAKADAEEQEKFHLAALKDKDDAHAQDRAEWYAAQTLLQEARVAMMREMLTGLNNATNFMQSVQTTIAERSTTAGELTGSVRELVDTVRRFRADQEEDIGRLGKRIEAAVAALEQPKALPAPRRT